MTKKLLGHIGVDAGLIWIGDPCYILHKEGKEKAELESVIGKNWIEFCDKLSGTVSFPYPLGHEGLGICTGGFGGDGTYPVYAEKDFDGCITRITIEFNDSEDDQ